MSKAKRKFTSKSVRKSDTEVAVGLRVDAAAVAVIAHRLAMASESAAFEELSILEETLPSETTKWSWRVDDTKPPKKNGDDPRWIEAQLKHLAMSQNTQAALIKLLQTPPTTLKGLLEVLDHFGSPCHRARPNDFEHFEYTVLGEAATFTDRRVNGALSGWLPLVADVVREWWNEEREGSVKAA